MSARFLTSWPCQDACGTIETDERVEGAPVYRCPGCDSSWIELNERVLPPGDFDTGPALRAGAGLNPAEPEDDAG